MRPKKYDIIFDLETCPVAPTEEEVARRKAVIQEELENWEPPASVKKAETRAAHRLAFKEKQAQRDVVTEYYEEKSFTPAYLEIVAFTLVLSEQGSGEIQDVITKAGWDSIQALPEIFSTHLHTPPRMVGYNSDGFDKPVLLSALIRHQIQLQPKLGASYDSWLDLRKVLTGFGGKGTLKEYTNLCGIDKYEEGEDGSRVREWALNGNWSDLAKYCEKDTVSTAELYCRLTRCLNI